MVGRIRSEVFLREDVEAILKSHLRMAFEAVSTGGVPVYWQARVAGIEAMAVAFHVGFDVEEEVKGFGLLLVRAPDSEEVGR